MLSFLREQSYEDLPAQKASAATATKAGGGSEAPRAPGGDANVSNK